MSQVALRWSRLRSGLHLPRAAHRARDCVRGQGALQTALDESALNGSRNYWKFDFVSELRDEAIDIIIEHVNRMASPLSQMHVHHLVGAMRTPPSGGSAFPSRDASFVYNLIVMWTEPPRTTITSAWCATSMRRVSMGGRVHQLSSMTTAPIWSVPYGENFGRLQWAEGAPRPNQPVPLQPEHRTRLIGMRRR